MARRSECAAIHDILQALSAIDGESNRRGKSELKWIVSMLTRLIQRTDRVAKGAIEYEYEYASTSTSTAMLSTSPRHPPHPNANGHNERHYDARTRTQSAGRYSYSYSTAPRSTNRSSITRNSMSIAWRSITLHSRNRLRSRFVVISGTSETNGCEQRCPSR